MKKEGKIFLTAVMFLTRIPVPGTIDHSPVYLQQARRYFPVVGWIVGAFSSLAFLVFSRYVSTDAGIVASRAPFTKMDWPMFAMGLAAAGPVKKFYIS
jgi:adenosylcobinamide-GDP ribazoletransferase